MTLFSGLKGNNRGQVWTSLTISIDRSIRLLKIYPFAAAEIEPDIRRWMFDRFPYALIYGIEGETIVIVAVAHTRRDLHYWTDRVS